MTCMSLTTGVLVCAFILRLRNKDHRCTGLVPFRDRICAEPSQQSLGRFSVIVPWCSLTRRNPLILDRRLEHHPMRKLVDHATLDLLPGGLAAGNLEAPLLRQRLFAAVALRLADQDIGGTLVQIDANPVTGFQDREPAPGCRFRGSVQDRRGTRLGRLPSVAELWQF